VKSFSRWPEGRVLSSPEVDLEERGVAAFYWGSREGGRVSLSGGLFPTTTEKQHGLYRGDGFLSQENSMPLRPDYLPRFGAKRGLKCAGRGGSGVSTANRGERIGIFCSPSSRKPIFSSFIKK